MGTPTDRTRELGRHLHAVEQCFGALQQAEALRRRDPARGVAARREAIRQATEKFTVTAVDDLRRGVTAVAFARLDGVALLRDFDEARALLPEADAGEGWLAGFLTFLTALHGVLARAVAGGPQGNPLVNADPTPRVAIATDAPPGAVRHFTPKELGELWAVDETTIRRLFQDEPGVLKIGKSGRRDGRRDYVSLRIPESVALRVHQRRSAGARVGT